MLFRSVVGTLNSAQALDVRQAVAAFTRNPAKAMGLEDRTGMLRAGLSADFIVLDRNIFTVDPGEIHAVQVQETWFEGQLVHDAAAKQVSASA